jgi:hypothetical protein
MRVMPNEPVAGSQGLCNNQELLSVRDVCADKEQHKRPVSGRYVWGALPARDDASAHVRVLTQWLCINVCVQVWHQAGGLQG